MYKSKGFTLPELLIVIAIIAVLVAVSIPIFSKQLENSRNRTDAYNAKVIEHTVQVYFMTKPEELKKLQTICATGTHYAQITVTQSIIKCPEPIATALKEAGILGNAKGNNNYDGFKCQSKTNWTSYKIGVSTFPSSTGQPEDVPVFRYYADDDQNAKAVGWNNFGKDTSGFSEMVRGTK